MAEYSNTISFVGSRGVMATSNINPEPSNINVRGWYTDKSKGGNGGCCRITLQCPQAYNDPFGYGLRVVGQHISNTSEDKTGPQQNSMSTFARVLWLSPGGVSESAGINVGDRVCYYYLKNKCKLEYVMSQNG